MSPAQFNDGQMPKRDMNYARPSPLKINKDSHFIHKSSSSLSSSSSSSSSLHHPTGMHQQRHRPVIIYTHSPKIIHTQPCDFMALVQKLTGLSQSDDEDIQPPLKPKGQASSPEASNNNMIAVGHDDNESSSVITDDNCCGGGLRDIRASSSSVSTIFDPPNSYIPHIPLFNRAQTDFFYAPRPFYRYPDYPNIDSSISPLILEAAKGFSEYGN